MQRIAVEERRARLVRRHRLSRADRAASALETARSLVVLHSSDAATVFMSVLARTNGVSPEDIERELYDERSLVRMLAMRRTLFVVPRELAPIVQAAATNGVAERQRRRLEQWIISSGIAKRPSAWLERASAAALEELEARGEAFTSDLTRAVPLLSRKIHLSVGSRWEATQNVGVRVVQQLAMEGRVIRGRPRTTWANGHYRWVPTAAWLGSEIERIDAAPAQAELLRRWLAAFGPATETDIRWWTGWSARESRGALAAVPHTEVALDGARGYVLADDLAPTDPPDPSAALLPTLDPTTMGWKERDWYLGPHARVLFDVNGNAGPTVWWEGRVVGGWSQRRDGEIVYELLEDVGAEAVRAVEAEVDRLADWLGDVRVSPGFLPPFQRGLAV